MSEQEDNRRQTLRQRTAAAAVREENTQQKIRTKSRWVLVLLLVLLVLSVFTALSLTVFFKVESVTVTDGCPYSREEVAQAAGIRQGENLFLLSEETVKANLRASLPYAGEVTLTRHLPHTVEISVTPAKAAFAMRDVYGSYTLTESSYRVLEQYAARVPEGAVEVTGVRLEDGCTPCRTVPFSDPNQKTLLTDLMQALQEHEFLKITSLDLSNDSDLRAVFEDRIVLALGSQGNLDYKLRCARKTLTEKYADPATEGVLDLSLLTGEGNQIFFRAEKIHQEEPVSSEEQPGEVRQVSDIPVASDLAGNP